MVAGMIEGDRSGTDPVAAASTTEECVEITTAVVTRIGEQFQVTLEGKFPLGTWRVSASAPALSQIGEREYGSAPHGGRAEARLRREVFTFEARTLGTFRLRAELKSISDDGAADVASPTMAVRMIPVVVRG
jgi:hypothetical protein